MISASTGLETGPISQPVGPTEGTPRNFPFCSWYLDTSTRALCHFLKANKRILGHCSVAFALPRFPVQVSVKSEA